MDRIGLGLYAAADNCGIKKKKLLYLEIGSFTFGN
jgi:hypothetical protein